MEYKDEVHSDDGSFELINFDDYAGNNEHLDMNADVSSTMDISDDGSYDFLCSEVSETLVLTEGEALNRTTVSEDNPSEEIKTFSFELAKWDWGFELPSKYDPAEEDEEFSGMDIPDSVDMGKKRNFMTMAYENSNFDVFDYPTHIKLKDDIKIKDVVKKDILRYLPAKSLARSRLVSKEWDQWISSPFLAHMQSQYFRKTSGFFQDENGAIRFISLDKSAYGVPYPSLHFLPCNVFIRSSCNGLLLCQACDEENEYYVCNPANREWIKLPSSSYYHGKEPKIVLAFGPSSLNFEPCYQVICPFSLPDLMEGPIVYFDIYDSNTKSWRTSDMICVDLDESDVKSDGIFVDGVVYWETTRGELLAFDLKNEIYGVQTLPFGEGGAVSKVYGELSYVKARYFHPKRMCILDVYSGSLMSLKNTIAFDISFEDLKDGEFVECMVLANSCDDVVAVILKKSGGPNCLYVYHVKDQKAEGPRFLWSSDISKLFPYVNSLVSVAA